VLSIGKKTNQKKEMMSKGLNNLVRQNKREADEERARHGGLDGRQQVDRVSQLQGKPTPEA
jgi:hypothetical protein